MNELDARDYFARGEAPFSQQWYSAYVGGPIRRNSLHYFGSFEGLRQEQTAVVTSPLMPGEYPQETRNIKFLTKLDYQMGSSQHLTFRYNFDGGRTTNNGVGGLNTIERGGITKPRRQDYQGSLTSVVSPRVVNEFRVQYAPLNSGNRAGQLGAELPGVSGDHAARRQSGQGDEPAAVVRRDAVAGRRFRVDDPGPPRFEGRRELQLCVDGHLLSWHAGRRVRLHDGPSLQCRRRRDLSGALRHRRRATRWRRFPISSWRCSSRTAGGYDPT